MPHRTPVPKIVRKEYDPDKLLKLMKLDCVPDIWVSINNPIDGQPLFFEDYRKLVVFNLFIDRDAITGAT